MSSNSTMSGLSAEYLAESKVIDLYVGYSIPIPLEILSTGLRLWAELCVHRNGLAFDDYMMITATVVSVALCGSGLALAVPNGMGRHIEAVSGEDFRMVMLAQYVMSHLYHASVVLTKLSVLALYYRAFPSRTFHKIVIVTAVIICAWLVAMELFLGLVCHPIASFWGDVDGFCYDMCAYCYFNNIFNLCADLWIFVLPLPLILRFRVRRTRKMLLGFLFSVGLATCIVSAVRIAFNEAQCVPDKTWMLVELTIFSMWEPLGGILCANLPIIYKPLGMAICRSFGWSTSILEDPTPQTRTDSTERTQIMGSISALEAPDKI
ncbi:hypothetical protein BJX61DRAFT_542886 [Aspergillus egyptiacus]|nr:hypothetical protein BJX61DRAFT_542886 [Aspergillus egyptiacus]